MLKAAAARGNGRFVPRGFSMVGYAASRLAARGFATFLRHNPNEKESSCARNPGIQSMLLLFIFVFIYCFFICCFPTANGWFLGQLHANQFNRSTRLYGGCW